MEKENVVDFEQYKRQKEAQLIEESYDTYILVFEDDDEELFEFLMDEDSDDINLEDFLTFTLSEDFYQDE